jgi:hypothetical protein
MIPFAVDLYCGLGGFTDGLLAEGYDVIGFDIERHVYGEHRYPAQLVIQDVLTLHGSQIRDAGLIVASPPCQEYSYMAMPWSRAKAKAAAIRADQTGAELERLNALFNACFRIQREACEAAGRHIPLVVENVRGAQPWVGRARWNFGSFYLWGDVPALMPAIVKTPAKRPGHDWNRFKETGETSPHWRADGEDSYHGSQADRATKNSGGSWFNVAHNTTSGKGQNPDGRKLPGFRFDGSGRSFQSASVEGVKNGNDWFSSGENCSLQRRAGSKSSARKFASAMIAKIPLPLSRHIARTYKPRKGETNVTDEPACFPAGDRGAETE